MVQIINDWINRMGLFLIYRSLVRPEEMWWDVVNKRAVMVDVVQYNAWTTDAVPFQRHWNHFMETFVDHV